LLLFFLWKVETFYLIVIKLALLIFCISIFRDTKQDLSQFGQKINIIISKLRKHVSQITIQIGNYVHIWINNEIDRITVSHTVILTKTTLRSVSKSWSHSDFAKPRHSFKHLLQLSTYIKFYFICICFVNPKCKYFLPILKEII
jgi:hypothetical protein